MVYYWHLQEMLQNLAQTLSFISLLCVYYVSTLLMTKLPQSGLIL